MRRHITNVFAHSCGVSSTPRLRHCILVSLRSVAASFFVAVAPQVAAKSTQICAKAPTIVRTLPQWRLRHSTTGAQSYGNAPHFTLCDPSSMVVQAQQPSTFAASTSSSFALLTAASPQRQGGLCRVLWSGGAVPQWLQGGGERRTFQTRHFTSASTVDASGLSKPGTSPVDTTMDTPQMHNGLISIRLPGSTSLEVLNVTGTHVGHVKDALMAKYKQRFSGVDPDKVLLYKLSDDCSIRTLLEATQKLTEAGLFAGGAFKLAVVIAITAAEEIIMATPAQAYSLIGREARITVDAARKYRSTLAGVSALTGLQECLAAADAGKLGITVLRKDASGNVAVGMFDLPPLNLSADMLPKTFHGFARHSQKMLLLPQRMQFAFEAVQAVRDGMPFGVHLSGPNGVGKSAILLLVHLLCMARRLPAVYIPHSESLVNDAREDGGGDAFILEAFWQQNADLIIEIPALRRVFIGALQDDEKPFTPHVMQLLREAVGKPGLPGLAVLMDDVQHISDEVKASKVSAAPSSVQTAGRYFAVNWHDWTNATSRFQRMSAASAHAEQDTQLPAGESARLRIVEPLDSDDRDALQADPASPAYVHNAAARVYIVRIAGTVLRTLVECAGLLPRNRTPTQEDLEELWQTMWWQMFFNCSGWLASLPEGGRDSAASYVMDLLSGNVQWDRAMILYDRGIVFRSASSPYVKPVSIAASAVLLRVTSACSIARRVCTSSIADGRQRGFELERQVLARLDGFPATHGVPSKRLDGTATSALDLSCGYSLPFRRLDEVLAQDVPVLFCPISRTYPCDAILMPAAGSGGVVHVIECSFTDPIDAERVQKVGDYFRPGGLVEQLRARGCEVVVVICHDSDLPVRQNLSDAAIAVSAGLVPPAPPLAATNISVSVAVAPLAVTAAQTLPFSKKAASLQLTRSAGIGDVVRVVDAQSLVRPLGVLVWAMVHDQPGQASAAPA